MLKGRILLAVAIAGGSSVGLARASRASDVMNPMFAYTHVQPTPFTLPAGRLSFGTNLGLGLTDFLTVSTNIVRDAYQFYNAQAKVSLWDEPLFASALTLGYERYNYQDIDPRNPDLTVQSWLPGAVAAFALGDRVALITGAQFNFTQSDLRTDAVETSGYVRGASAGADLSWAYNPPTKRRNISNALAVGATYDFTYKIYGVGLSHHWPGFHLGIHYFPNASQYRVMPIIAGGGSVDL